MASLDESLEKAGLIGYAAHMPDGNERSSKRRGAAGDTRQRMTEALREILKTKPVAAIRTAEVSAAVGMTQPNFYKHFNNLPDALHACAQLSWTSYPQIGALIREDMGLTDARKVVGQIVEFWREHKTTLDWGYSIEIGATVSDYVAMREAGQRNLANACEAQLLRSAAAGRLPPGIDARLASYFLVSRLDNFGMAYGLVCDFAGYSPEVLVDTGGRMLLVDLGLAVA